MHVPPFSRLLATIMLTALSGCADQSATTSHTAGNPVHVVATAPPTCPVCALYSVHRAIEFSAAGAGKTAYYALRWVSTRGEKGPWSDVTTATVAA